MTLKKLVPALWLLLLATNINAQALTQTVKGVVVDKISQLPIPGVVVTLLNVEPQKATVTDEDGNFKFTDVPVGKQTIGFSMMGYKNFTQPNIVVNSGKEVVMTVALDENVIEADEVVITAKVEKNKPLNDMSVVSTRTFSVEETQKYAAAVNDPARMAAAFAGVVQPSGDNNAISIRGNSPNGVLWRMEGVDIPNPNHFSNVGTAGGGISILSAQLLTNSDFTTGAFAAEYGNALSGVFDLKLRKGNNEKREYTLQAGLMGIDLATEGPFKKGYGGSYLINYRYSTFGLLSKLGLDLGGGVTTFQDLSFNVSLPTKKLGNFTVFGFGGLSAQTNEAVKDTVKWAEDEFYRVNAKFKANTGATGITHIKPLNNKSFLKTALVVSGTKNAYDESKLNDVFESQQQYTEEFVQHKITLSSTFNYKFNSRHSLRTGIIVNRLGYKLAEKSLNDSTLAMETHISNAGTAYTTQAFAQWKYRISGKFTLNTGVHYTQFFLNNTQSLEPRAAIKYDISQVQSVSLGYGLHSQLQPLGVYFIQMQNSDGSVWLPNHDLGLSKAHHIVLAYDRSLTEQLRIKAETYYQALFNIPQGVVAADNFSLLNQQGGYDYRTLNGNGTGRNYGVELTVEQFMHRNFYLLGSASLYESKYKGTDGKMYDTRYNGNYALSLTAGKDFELAAKYKKRVIGLNMKLTYCGGFRDTPIDAAASIRSGEAVFINSQAFTRQNPAYFRPDIRISLKRNYAKATGTLALDVQNVVNYQNIGGQYYDSKTLEVKYWYQVGLIPVLSYRLEF